MNRTPAKPKALVLPSIPRLNNVCSEECRRLIDEAFDPVYNESAKEWTPSEVAERIGDAEIILTTWGSPVLTDELLEKAVKLRAIGHAAGTVKNRMPRAVFERGIRVYSAANRIALSVGEHCLAVLLLQLKKLQAFDRGVHQGGWNESKLKGNELTGATIGIVSASSTAREFIRLLAPFRVRVLLYDPYLSQERADQLGVQIASLEEVMQCRIISVHAPSLPATYRMITEEHISMIPEGAVVINSSRGAVFDEEPFIRALTAGRFSAALDVFDKEPLVPEHPFRNLPNVLLTPHIAGASVEGHLSLMSCVVGDIIDGMNGKPTSFEVNEKMWDTMA
jgi:phosphoglycerate dehydrogenase-like enzyme